MPGVLKLAAFAMAMSAFLPIGLLAQGGSIRGRVADTSGTPVADALVWVEATALRAMSSANGEYVIGAVPAGSAVLRVRRIGYVDIAPAARVTVLAGQTVQHDFVLRNAPYAAPVVASLARDAHRRR